MATTGTAPASAVSLGDHTHNIRTSMLQSNDDVERGKRNESLADSSLAAGEAKPRPLCTHTIRWSGVTSASELCGMRSGPIFPRNTP